MAKNHQAVDIIGAAGATSPEIMLNYGEKKLQMADFCQVNSDASLPEMERKAGNLEKIDELPSGKLT